MTWGAIGGAAVSVVGGALMSDKGDKNGGAGSQQQTQSKEPWAAAQPWIMSNMAQGQKLQKQYTDQPFSAQQNAAYDNSYGLSNYARAVTPSLLGQLSNQTLGFNRSNPTAKPTAFNFDGVGANGGGAGLLSLLNARPPAGPATTVKPPAEEPGDFRQMSDGYSLAAGQYGTLAQASQFGRSQNNNFTGQLADILGNSTLGEKGGYGKFTYGMDVQPGTQEYRDLQNYLAWGGKDPAGLYTGGGHGTMTGPANFMTGLWNGQRPGEFGFGGDGAGADGDGAGPGGAGATW